jgi:lipopolysaccharide/colanic/teichoic acid biosynthesis glycosyltransferase
VTTGQVPLLEFVAAPRPRHILWEGRPIPIEGDDRPLAYRVKRTLDVVVAAVVLVVLSPLLLAVALLIRCTSDGPALFVQQRWGSRRRRLRGGAVEWEARTFGCIKFRTMVDGADPDLHVRHVQAFVSGDLAPEVFEDGVKLVGDGRITPLGGLLRRTCMDELPQLLNVLRGEMSLVGPRPVPLYEVDSYPGEWCLGRLGALPGLTGTWQVSSRCVTQFDEMIRMDLEYVRRPSLLRDLTILCMTVPCVLAARGDR